MKSWHFVMYCNRRFFLDAVLLLSTFSVLVRERKKRVHNCSERGHVGHIFPHMTFARFSTLQPNPILCYRLFPIPFWLIYHTFPSFLIFLCNIFRLSFYPVPLLYFPPFLFRYSFTASFDIASQRFQLCSFS